MMSSYNDLPLEVIANIYKYLDVIDIKSAQLTCSQWLCASLLLDVENRTVLKLTSANAENQQLFSNSFRKFSNIHLVYNENNSDKTILNEENLLKFFEIENINGDIKNLVLEKLGNTISFEGLCEILKLLPKLEELKCIKTYFNFSEENLLQQSQLISNIISTKIKSIILSGDYYTHRNSKVFSQVKNLEKFGVETFVYKDDSNLDIFHIIKNNENCLKCLILEYDAVNALLDSQQLLCNLKLREVSLKLNHEYPQFADFIKSQNLITNLSLINCFELTDWEMITILENLPLLERININQNILLTDITMFEISKLKNLKYLNINECWEIGRDGIINGLAKNMNNKLIELKCVEINLPNDAFLEISNKLSNLQVLHCGGFRKTINDTGIQYIIKNLRNLIDLSIYSSEVTDYGITGVDLQTKHKTGSCLSELRHLNHLNLQCEITDQTLLHGIKFKNLKTLHLRLHYPFSIYDSAFVLNVFTQNSPSIEELSLDGILYNENVHFDEAIEILITNLTKLKRIYIKGHCEKDCTSTDWTRINIFLIKFRKDLSTVEIDCDCKICINLKYICEKFTRK
ncbi:uncharacterized protein LOC129610682 [Condylostylus longicornis]|uniref:uncharacterized protein LOC129610682 n=1 Tax=Condylostylus longicornis TaxID=2530218 RepID=UPI00244E3D5D|nr:uncharacterized protein LOC129610682 [Condylostylus longicornis]XP_055379304.1 uncharacterized protein LOC129610682 [Condylostylus longicornis]